MTKLIEVTEDMTKAKQLEATLKNKMVDVESVTPAKTIFYIVKTNKGTLYFVESHEIWKDIWRFEEVTEQHFNAID